MALAMAPTGYILLRSLRSDTRTLPPLRSWPLKVREMLAATGFPRHSRYQALLGNASAEVPLPWLATWLLLLVECMRLGEMHA